MMRRLAHPASNLLSGSSGSVDPPPSTREEALEISDACLDSLFNATTTSKDSIHQFTASALYRPATVPLKMLDLESSPIPEDPVGAQLDNEIASLQSQSKHLCPSPVQSLTHHSRNPQSPTQAPSNNNSLLSNLSINSLAPQILSPFR
jgi:hypothetical protein